MASKRPRAGSGDGERGSGRPRYGRSLTAFVVLLLSLARVPVASAHGGTAVSGVTRLHGLAVVLCGIGLLGASVLCKRTDRLSPTAALWGVFLGIVVTVVGAVLFDGLSPDPTYAARSMPFPRAWYEPLSLLVGLSIAVLSLVIGWVRWPTRPRYTFLGLLMGLWVSYPYLLPGPASDTHPLGYAVVLATPLLVGYVVWTDAGSVLRAVVRDRTARRFGVGVGVVLAFFFVSVTGYLSFFPEESLPHERVVAVLPAVYQLVTWPILEVYLPHVPLFVAVSPGQLLVVGLLSALIGLNAMLIARHWLVDERAGLTEGTAGSAAVVGSCTCGCCGPLVAKVVVLAAGPSVAAPLYWVFVDTASPLSSLFVVASVVLFTGSLVYSVASARGADRSADVVPAD